jgi:Short C-terminal domain
MKKYFSLLTALSVLSLLGGCVIGSGPRTITQTPTVGQQLIDLQKAKDAGAITDVEFQTQKAKLLEAK